jgi:hypothetical protein
MESGENFSTQAIRVLQVATGEELRLTEDEMLGYWVAVVIHGGLMVVGMSLMIWMFPWWMTLLNTLTLIPMNWMICSKNSGSTLHQCRRLEMIRNAKAYLMKKENRDNPTNLEAFIGYCTVLNRIVDPSSLRSVVEEVVGAQVLALYYLSKLLSYARSRNSGDSTSPLI